MKRHLVLMISLMIGGCGGSSWLLVPNGHQQKIKGMKDAIEQREYLYGHSSVVMAVTRNQAGQIQSKQHFRPEHSLTFIWHLLEEFDGHNPGDLLHIKRTSPLGFAIKDNAGETDWKIYWFNKKHHEKQKKLNIYYLPEQPDERIKTL